MYPFQRVKVHQIIYLYGIRVCHPVFGADQTVTVYIHRGQSLFFIKRFRIYASFKILYLFYLPLHIRYFRVLILEQGLHEVYVAAVKHSVQVHVKLIVFVIRFSEGYDVRFPVLS